MSILLVATVTIGWEVMLYQGMHSLLIFFVATVVALLVHVLWWQTLQVR